MQCCYYKSQKSEWNILENKKLFRFELQISFLLDEPLHGKGLSRLLLNWFLICETLHEVNMAFISDGDLKLTAQNSEQHAQKMTKKLTCLKVCLAAPAEFEQTLHLSSHKRSLGRVGYQ